MKPLLHIAADERFIDRGISLFEAALPNQNHFWVWQRKGTKSLEFVKSLRPQSDRKIDYDSPWWKSHFINWSAYRAVLFHNLYSHPQIFFANSLPPNLPAYWLFFGAEYYNDPNFFQQTSLGPHTNSLPRSKRPTKSYGSQIKRISSFFQSRFRRANRATHPRTCDKRAAFQRINCFATHLPNELDAIKESLGINPLWLNFSYYTIEDFKSDNCDDIPKKNQILLGNSATPSNNHLEALYLLKQLKFAGTIKCPLSYGDELYRDAIKSAAKEQFGCYFQAIDDYLPLENYNRLIAESSVVLMNHYRQQALGNIITALWYGTRVFVSNRSSALCYFRKLGCVIHSIDEDLKSPAQLVALSDTERQTNRAVLSQAYATKTFVKAIQEMDTRINA